MFFTIEKIEHHLKEIQARVSREVFDIPNFKYIQGEAALHCKDAHRPEFDDSSWTDFSIGGYWGGYDITAWFRTRVPIPERILEQKLCLRFLVGPRDGGGSTAEALLYVNGQPLQGIDIWHEEAWLPPEHIKRGYIDIALKAWSGVIDVPDKRRFKLAQLVVINEPAERYYYLASTLLKAIQSLQENDLRRTRLLALLDQSLKCVEFHIEPGYAYHQSLEAASCTLVEGLAKMESGEIKPRITGIGHSHIDMAWLWRLRHTREKASRTFSTVLHLMRQYPEYRYLHSSPQLFKYLKEDYPGIYARIQDKVRSGEWEITGGMWVEADTNLVGGESLVRQILIGKRYIQEEFGVDMKTLWLPDAFGFSAALPQIIKKSGMDYFVTSKISWSQYNRFPYDTFTWTGIDGSRVLAHFITTPEPGSPFYTYNGSLEPAEVKGIWDNYQQKDQNEELLLLYGWGDGGGGPTREMLEMARVMGNIPGLPAVQLGKAEPFLERLEQQLSHKDIPEWDGELYLEYHRGTYTSQAFVKRANRKAEVLFHNVELFSAMADILTGSHSYPAEEIRSAWELMLLNQFHDILPGSSIRQVYEDCRMDYETIQAAGEKLQQDAQGRILAELPVQEESLVVLNPLSWKRTDLVDLSWEEWINRKGNLDLVTEYLPVQITENEGEKRLLVAVSNIPPLGYHIFPLGLDTKPMESERELEGPIRDRKALLAGGGSRSNERIPCDQIATRSVFSSELGEKQVQNIVYPAGGWGTEKSKSIKKYVGERRDKGQQIGGLALEGDMVVHPNLMENIYYRMQLNNNGQITSIWDKDHQREVLSPGARANVFQAFEDKPMNFDAWDIDIYYQEKMVEIDHLQESVVEEKGPLRCTLRLSWRFRNSTITQRIHMYRHTRRIDFNTEVDWHEQQTLLKTAFPVNIRATRATYDIQFGCVERSTHWNTSWDFARFESVAHKWVDLSEGNYGVSLLNDSKYGHDVKGNTIRLTLIKSGVYPDEAADQGRHQFTYALLPHTGDWRVGGVAREAYELNYPLLALRVDGLREGQLPPCLSLIAVDAENVVVESVKKAEDGEAWIVRVYENMQSRGRARLSFGRPVLQAVECNLIEEEDHPVEHDQDSFTISISPFEIKTFKVWFQRS
jgi:alpha-mannosidase